MTARFTPEFLTRAAEQLGWDATPAGQQKRQEDLALLQELMETTCAASTHRKLGPAAPCTHSHT